MVKPQFKSKQLSHLIVPKICIEKKAKIPKRVKGGGNVNKGREIVFHPTPLPNHHHHLIPEFAPCC